MSFKIGQLRKNQLGTSEYQTEIGNITEGTILTKSDISDLEFQEGGFSYNFKEGVTYYLQFDYSLKKPSDNYSIGGTPTIHFKLLNSDGAEMTIEQASSTGSVNKIIVFTPNRNYNYFIVQIQRNTAALRVSDLYFNINVDSFYQLKDILQASNFKNKFSEVSSIKKLGLQAPEGFIFAVNGKGFKVGKSGIYELSGIDINHLCFYINKGDTYFYPYEKQTEQFFIMDFEY